MRTNVREFVCWISENYQPRMILEIGSFKVAGQEELAELRPFFPGSFFCGLDLRAGPGVDLVGDAQLLPFKDNSFDLVLCLDTIEHVLNPWQVIKEVRRILKPQGIFVLSSVMDFPIHDYPWDFWRFTPEIFQKFGELIGKCLVFYQGHPLMPDTILLIASKEGSFPEPPVYLEGRPLMCHGKEEETAIEIFGYPYRPRFAPRRFLISPDSSWGVALNLVPEGVEVLDIGCGTGFWGAALKYFKKCKLWGVENNPFAASKASKVYEEVLLLDLEKNSLEKAFKKRRFDVVCLLDILEHLRFPEKTLRETQKLLKPKGFVLISIPNITHATVLAEILRGQFDYRLWGLLDETHLRFFSRKGVEALLERAGFVLEEIKRVIKAPEHTEFDSSSWNDLPQEVKEFIRRHNPEYLTYQFVIKAHPIEKKSEFFIPKEAEDDLSCFLRLYREWSQEQIESLKRQLEEKDKLINMLLSSRSWRITAPLRWIFNKARKFRTKKL